MQPPSVLTSAVERGVPLWTVWFPSAKVQLNTDTPRLHAADFLGLDVGDGEDWLIMQHQSPANSDHFA